VKGLEIECRDAMLVPCDKMSKCNTYAGLQYMSGTVMYGIFVVLGRGWTWRYWLAIAQLGPVLGDA
jgi:hypothetical protein